MYRRSADIQALIDGLAWLAPDMVMKIGLLPSVEGHEISAIRVRSGSDKGRGVLFVGGLHARELMNPDLLIEAAMNLIFHHRTETDWVMGGQTWLVATLQTILNAVDVYFLPNANPDGREEVLDGYRLWRKNRATLEGTSCIGVDLNRNFELLWGIRTRDKMGNLTTSTNPCDNVFCGPAAFSEPETLNVKRMLDDYPIECLVDVHSFSELVLYPWGHAPNQTTDPTQRFNLVDTSVWDLLPNDAPNYREYVPPNDLSRFRRMGNSAAQAIQNVRGRKYTVQSTNDLYPTTGTSSEYAYSRHIADPSKRKVCGFAFETGPRVPSLEDSFQPPFPEADRIKEEATSGLISILASHVCSFDLIELDLSDDAANQLNSLREVRDRTLTSSEPGEAWVTLFEDHQLELAQLIEADRQLRGEGAELIVDLGDYIRSDDTLGAEVVERIGRFLSRLQGATRSDRLRRDLDWVKEVAPSFADKGLDTLVEFLSTTSPALRERASRTKGTPT